MKNHNINLKHLLTINTKWRGKKRNKHTRVIHLILSGYNNVTQRGKKRLYNL